MYTRKSGQFNNKNKAKKLNNYLNFEENVETQIIFFFTADILKL